MTWSARYWDFYDRYVVSVRRYPEYPVNRYYAHLIDPLFTKWAYDLRLSPNTVTTFALMAGLGTAACFLIGNFLSGAILLQLHHFLDGADGNLARLTKSCTKAGALFDKVSDRLVRVVVFSAVAWASNVSAVWCFAFLGVLVVDHLVVHYYVIPFMSRVELRRAKWKSWFLERGIIIGFDHFTLFFFISAFAVAGRLDLLVYVATALKALDVGYRLWECAKSEPVFSDLDEVGAVAKQVDFWTVDFDYWFSVRIVSLLRNSPVTPDQLTYASFASALCGGALLVADPLNWSSWIAAALLFQAAYILDCADGQLARLRGEYSKNGWRLDLYSDRLTETLILISTTYALAVNAPGYWLLGMSVLGATTLLQYSRVHELMHASSFSSQQRDVQPTNETSWTRRRLDRIEEVRRKHRLGFMNVGNFYFLNFVFLVAGRADLFLWSLLLVSVAATGFHIARSAAKQDDAEAGLQLVKNEGRKAVLFGAGEGAAQFVSGFRNREVEIAYVCDNNENRWGSAFFGASIRDPRVLAEESEDVVVFIASEWAGEIRSQLDGYGVPQEQVVSLY